MLVKRALLIVYCVIRLLFIKLTKGFVCISRLEKEPDKLTLKEEHKNGECCKIRGCVKSLFHHR